MLHSDDPRVINYGKEECTGGKGIQIIDLKRWVRNTIERLYGQGLLLAAERVGSHCPEYTLPGSLRSSVPTSSIWDGSNAPDSNTKTEVVPHQGPKNQGCNRRVMPCSRTCPKRAKKQNRKKQNKTKPLDSDVLLNVSQQETRK